MPITSGSSPSKFLNEPKDKLKIRSMNHSYIFAARVKSFFSPQGVLETCKPSNALWAFHYFIFLLLRKINMCRGQLSLTLYKGFLP